MDKTPIYPYPATYARENGELEQYRASLKALAECKCAIDDAIFYNWDGMNFAKDSAILTGTAFPICFPMEARLPKKM